MSRMLENRAIRLIILVLAVVLTIWGALNLGETVEKTHTETITWQDYSPSAEDGTYVSLTIKESAPWFVGCITEEASTERLTNNYHFKIYHLYGYIMCKDQNGQPLLLQLTEDINDMTELRAEKQWRKEFRDQLITNAKKIKGKEIYGKTTPVPKDLEIDYSYYLSGMPSLIYTDGYPADEDEEMAAARERQATLGEYKDITPYLETIPQTETITDGTTYQWGPGRIALSAAACLYLLFILSGITAARKRRK